MADLRVLGPLRPFDRDLLAGPAPQVAPALLGALLVRDLDGARVVARIVEVEAYREDDPASHSAAGRTARTEPMFGPPGTAYVYRSYGAHWCLNVTVEPEGVGAAVLVRSAVVLTGLDEVRRRRPGRPDRELLRGPGNLARGLEIDAPRHDGGDLLAPAAEPRLASDGWQPPSGTVARGPRVGVRLASDVAWRWWCAAVPEVSRYVRSPRAL